LYFLFLYYYVYVCQTGRTVTVCESMGW